MATWSVSTSTFTENNCETLINCERPITQTVGTTVIIFGLSAGQLHSSAKITLSMLNEISSDRESVISQNEKEIIEDIIENNETTEAITWKLLIADDLDFESDIDDQPDDLETLLSTLRTGKTRNCYET